MILARDAEWAGYRGRISGIMRSIIRGEGDDEVAKVEVARVSSSSSSGGGGAKGPVPKGPRTKSALGMVPRIMGGGSAVVAATPGVSHVPVDQGLPMPRIGEQIKVEVEEEGVTSWRPAEVRQLLRGRKFTACVDQDEGFIEVYTMVEEGVEWRRTVAPDDTHVGEVEAADLRNPQK